MLSAVLWLATSGAWLPNIRVTSHHARAAALFCDADVKEPQLVALTLADVRSCSMDTLEALIEEMEAAAMNHVEAEGGPHVHLSRLLATAHICYGDYELAVPHARAALDAGPDAEMHFLLGVEAERRNEEAEALEAYEDCLNVDPQCWRALFHIGKICLVNGWTEDAVDYLEQVAAINPEHKPTRLFLDRFGAAVAASSEKVSPADNAVSQPQNPAIELPTNGSLPEGLE